MVSLNQQGFRLGRTLAHLAGSRGHGNHNRGLGICLLLKSEKCFFDCTQLALGIETKATLGRLQLNYPLWIILVDSPICRFEGET